jgi:hypothetical protein
VTQEAGVPGSVDCLRAGPHRRIGGVFPARCRDICWGDHISVSFSYTRVRKSPLLLIFSTWGIVCAAEPGCEPTTADTAVGFAAALDLSVDGLEALRWTRRSF